jgi:aryl-alcohol dehydrogenase-like predicted oxidoreductase
LSLEGVTTVIVGWTSPKHLEENIAVATNFKRMSAARRNELFAVASSASSLVPAPWERVGYFDGR